MSLVKSQTCWGYIDLVGLKGFVIIHGILIVMVLEIILVMQECFVVFCNVEHRMCKVGRQSYVRFRVLGLDRV
jgi:hypothetical protein